MRVWLLRCVGVYYAYLVKYQSVSIHFLFGRAMYVSAMRLCLSLDRITA